MSFERTKGGQQNRAVFLGVDYVCYVEGGGGESEYSDDVTFWKGVFGVLRPGLRIHFQAKGGKPELESRAANIISENICNTIAAMDSDYDDLTKDKIEDSRILYTYGYSWENDAFCKPMITKIFSYIAKNFEIDSSEHELLHDEYERIRLDLIWPVRADFYALVAKCSVFPRKSPGRIISRDKKKQFPVIDRKEVVKLCKVANKNAQPRNLPSLPKLEDSMRYCVGKIYLHTMWILICAVLKEFGKSDNTTPNHFRDLGLLLFRDFLNETDHDQVSRHYDQIVSAI